MYMYICIYIYIYGGFDYDFTNSIFCLSNIESQTNPWIFPPLARYCLKVHVSMLFRNYS